MTPWFLPASALGCAPSSAPCKLPCWNPNPRASESACIWGIEMTQWGKMSPKGWAWPSLVSFFARRRNSDPVMQNVHQQEDDAQAKERGLGDQSCQHPTCGTMRKEVSFVGGGCCGQECDLWLCYLTPSSWKLDREQGRLVTHMVSTYEAPQNLDAKAQGSFHNWQHSACVVTPHC
jgi:hypothetical protein